jgi:hypothetical protein
MSDLSKSREAKLEIPEFKSTIPGHLLGKLSDSERYIIETLSKIENQSDWLVKLAVADNTDLILLLDKASTTEDMLDEVAKTADKVDTIDKRVSTLWDWHQMLSGKWTVLWALLLIIVPVFLKYVLDLITKKGP